MKIINAIKRNLNKAKTSFDVLIIGGGHNGLVAAAYLQKSGLEVCVLERRNVVGGAAVTEEIFPNYKFSRASYVLSLLRPQIYKELELKKYGLKVHLRNPSSYTPLREDYWKKDARSLILGQNLNKNVKEISKFSKKDAERYQQYEEYLSKLVAMIDPVLDLSPYQVQHFLDSSLVDKAKVLMTDSEVRRAVKQLTVMLKSWPKLYEVMTSPILKILTQWFESEPLIATLATDGVIGSMMSPHTPGSGYVLLHHVMGGLDGVPGAWGYPEGGMGAVTQALAAYCIDHGVEIKTDKAVKRINLDDTGRAVGVITCNGEEYKGKLILSNATAKVTFLDLIQQGALPESYEKAVKNIDYTSPVTKINVALKKLPNFLANPNTTAHVPMPHHQCTIHINCENVDVVTQSYRDAADGKISSRPMIEMVLPSTLDQTLSPPGCHVCLLFTQYTPYHLPDGQHWGEETKEDYARRVFSIIDEYSPGFSDNVLAKEVLTPVDIEKIFGLTGGNIFQGAITPNQLFYHRPVSEQVCGNNQWLSPRTPVSGLLMCGSSAHPGGGVTGAPGRIAAREAIKILKNIKTK